MLENDYLKSNKIIKNGFLCFARQNWKKILLDNMLSFVAISVFLAIMDGYLIKDIALKIIISTFLIISVFPIFILIEWLGHRDIIRKYHNCFRPKLYMIKNKGTENREYRFVTDEVINKKYSILLKQIGFCFGWNGKITKGLHKFWVSFSRFIIGYSIKQGDYLCTTRKRV